MTALRLAWEFVARTMSVLRLVVLGLLGLLLSIVIVAALALLVVIAKPDRPPPPSPDYSPLLHGKPFEDWAKAVTPDEIYALPCVVNTEGKHPDRLAFEKVVKSRMDYDHPIRTLIGKHAYLIPWGYFLFRPMPTSFNCPDFRTNGIQFLIPGFDRPGFQKDYSRLYGGIGDADDTDVVRVENIVGYGEYRDMKYAIYGELELLKLSPGSAGTVPAFGLWRKRIGDKVDSDDLWFYLDRMDGYLVRCYLPAGSLEDFCHGDIDYKDLRLRAEILIRRGAIPQSVAIVKGLRSLLTRWRDPAETSAPRPH